MKKVLLVLFMICMCLSGCSNDTNKPTVGGDGSTYDYVEYDTVEKMNEAAGTNIVTAAVAGKEDEKFGVISNNIAQYTFTCNGEKWCVRASKDIENDISGLYYDSIEFKNDVNSTYYLDEVYMTRFFYNDVQYVISLDTKNHEISESYFDTVSNEFKTNITGVKSGYENEVIEDGDDIIMQTTIYNSDGSQIVSQTIYTFENDKVVKILSKTIFETTEEAQNYYDLLIENGSSPDSVSVEGSTLISDMSGNIDFYSDYTKDSLLEQLKG